MHPSSEKTGLHSTSVPMAVTGARVTTQPAPNRAGIPHSVAGKKDEGSIAQPVFITYRARRSHCIACHIPLRLRLIGVAATPGLEAGAEKRGSESA